MGVVSALSLIHGGPATQFFSDSVADYIVNGIEGVNPVIGKIPDDEIKK